MPLDLNAKLQLAKTDPHLISYIFGGIPAEDTYFYDRLGGDFAKYEEMLLDPQIRGKLSERVGALLGRSVIVESSFKRQIDQDAADLARRIVEDSVIPYEQICSSFLFSGLIFGFAVMAVRDVQEKTIYFQDEESDRITKQTVTVPLLEFVPQRRFIFQHLDPDAVVHVCTDEDIPLEEIALVNGYELRLLTRRSPQNGERCPKNRFFTFSFGSIKGLPQGYGLGAQIRRFYEIRREVLKSGVLTAERLGSPPVHGTYPDDLDERNPDDLLALQSFNSLLRAIAPNAWASTSTGFNVNFPEPSKIGGHEILKWLYETAGVEITRAVWGEGSYAEKSTGSYAAAQREAENRNENIVDSDCNALDEQLSSQLWAWIAEQNYPKANPPIVRRETFAERREAEQEQLKEERRSKRITSDVNLVNVMGLTPTQEYIDREYGVEWRLPEQEEVEEEVIDPELSEGEVEFAANVDRYLDWNGLKLGIRNLTGQTRFPQYRSAKKLQSGYGFVQGYQSNGKALRCYIHPDLLKDEPQGSDRLFAVTQLTKDGSEDEVKVMVGFPSIEAAELAYRREMPEWAFGGVRSIEVGELGEFVEFGEGELKLFFFAGRRSGVVAQNAEQARKKMKRGGSKLVKVRALTEEEKKLVAKGIWVRTGPHGEPAGYKRTTKRGFGPKPKGYKG